MAKENTGALFPNNKQKDNHPDYRGKGTFNGVEFEISGWKRTSEKGNEYISLSLSEPYRKEG